MTKLSDEYNSAKKKEELDWELKCIKDEFDDRPNDLEFGFTSWKDYNWSKHDRRIFLIKTHLDFFNIDKIELLTKRPKNNIFTNFWKQLKLTEDKEEYLLSFKDGKVRKLIFSQRYYERIDLESI
jgi:hypothetical protein